MNEDRYSRLMLADQHLRRVFSKYPRPIKIEACPCGCCPDPDSVLRGISSRYIGKAISTWGSAEDFKYFLPQILSFVGLEGNEVVSNFLVGKLNYVTAWEPGELSAIQAWFFAYANYKFVTDFERTIHEMRTCIYNVPDVLLAKNKFESPFHNLAWGDFKEMRALLSFNQREELEDMFLSKWPQDDVDCISFALGIDFSDITDLRKLFTNDKVSLWLSLNKEKIERCFWKSSDERIQKACSDALEIIALC